MNQLYLSANHLSSRNIPAFIAALEQYRITHLIAYSSSATILAREALELGMRISGIKVAITNAEPLFPWQRETIHQALGCEVRETYGMAEIAAAASECSAGKLHIWPEVGWLEVLGDLSETPMIDGEAGRLICTGLLNIDMPLIRYAVGDRGRVALQQGDCGCNRLLPAIASIEGRTNDVLLTADGRRVFWVNPVLYGIPVREAQIIQESLLRVRVRYVAAPGFASTSGRLIVERLQARLGSVEVVLDEVGEIPRSANGKFRAVVSNIPQPEQASTADTKD